MVQGSFLLVGLGVYELTELQSRWISNINGLIRIVMGGGGVLFCWTSFVLKM